MHQNSVFLTGLQLYEQEHDAHICAEQHRCILAVAGESWYHGFGLYSCCVLAAGEWMHYFLALASRILIIV